MARVSGGANNMRPLSWGSQTEKIQNCKCNWDAEIIKNYYCCLFISLQYVEPRIDCQVVYS